MDQDCATVLIVEDEPLILFHESQVAENAGFTVLEAHNADEALVALEEHAEIDILLTDVRMPGTMDGLELARMVRRRWPGIGIVIASGHVRSEEEALLPPDAAYLPKPFTPHELASTLEAFAA